MPFPITVPYTFGSLTGVVQLSYLDSNFTPIVTALNGISSGTYPLVTPVLGTPTSATLTNATGLPLTTGVTGTLAVTNGGTGVTTSTGSGNNVLSTSPTLVTPILGTPTSGTLTNATGLPLTTGVTGTLPVANGGTNITTYATGDILYASASNTLSKLTAGTNGYVLTLAAGVPTWAAGGGGSSAITVNTTTITGGTTGRVLYDNAGTVGELATTGSGNVVLATSPTLVTPILGTPTSGTLTNATGLPLTTGVTGTLPVANGGTGAATLTANAVLIGNGTSAVTAVAPGTTGNLLTSDGTNWTSTANTGVSTGKAIAMAIVFGG